MYNMWLGGVQACMHVHAPCNVRRWRHGKADGREAEIEGSEVTWRDEGTTTFSSHLVLCKA